MKMNDVVIGAWHQARIEHGLAPDECAPPDLTNIFTRPELATLELIIRADVAPELAKISINLLRKLADSQLTDDEEAMVLLSLVRKLTAPTARSPRGRPRAARMLEVNDNE
jgi:hypothetical protein